MGALLIPALVGAASAGVGYYNNRQTLAQQNRLATQGFLAQQQLQDRANSNINAELDQLQRSSPQQPAADTQATFLANMQRARASAAQSVPSVAGADPRYAKAIASGAAPYTAAGNQQAADAARMAAPGLQRLGEAGGIQNLAASLGELATQSKARNFLTQLAVNSTQPNPWLTALSAAGQGISSGMASRAYYNALFPKASPTAGMSVPTESTGPTP